MKNEKKNDKNGKNTPYRVNFSAKMSTDEGRIDTDPYGSYTGVPDDPYDQPIQDADDL